MRIAIIGSRGIPARYGGFETFAQELAPRLVELGHEVTVYCRKGYTGEEPLAEFRGVRLIQTPYLRRRSLETLSHEASSIADSLRRAFDLYYFLGTRSSPLYVPLRLSSRSVVIHTDGIEWKRRKWSTTGRAYLKLAEWIAAKLAGDALVTDAGAMHRYYLERYGRDSTFIPYGAPLVEGCDTGRLATWGLTQGGYLLVVCRLEPENNLDAIVRGFVESGSQRELIIVGAANYETPYHRRLQTLAGGARVRFLGAVYGDDLVALRTGAFAYLHGHEVGGTNPSLLEAMGCGTCVLALDTEFNREALGDAGLFWRPGSLAGSIRRVEDDPADAVSLGIRARDRAAEHYRWDAVAQAHDRLFRELPT